MSREYWVTFGQRYAREEHPTFPAAHPDGWLVFEVADHLDHRAAYAAIWQVLGERFSDASQGPFRAHEWDLYPRGELARIQVAEDPNERVTPSFGIP